MRLGVLDIGSNTGHLLVVDAYRGAAPMPASSYKEQLRLAEHLEKDGTVSQRGIDALTDFVGNALTLAEDKGCEEIYSFATSAVRDAGNCDEVLAHVEDRTGVEIKVLPGEDEARLTFLAVRRWFGWSSGRLAVFDIGGGSLEVAGGDDESPDVAWSLPLGAGRLTREEFADGVPGEKALRKLRKRIRTEIAHDAGTVLRGGAPDHAVATSKTFRSLARICGRRRLQRGVVRTPPPARRRPRRVDPQAPRHERRRHRGAAGSLERSGTPGPRRCPGGGRRDGRLRPLRARGLPVGAARRRDPGPARPAQRSRLSPGRTVAPQFALSTASVYPETTSHAFEYADKLGYDAVEVMVGIDIVSQSVQKVRSLSEYHQLPVCAVHAPCLLITQRVWGTDPWAKLERSAEMAQALDADVVVVHPPFRWQRDYASRVRRGDRRPGAAYGRRLRRREHVSRGAPPRGGR